MEAIVKEAKIKALKLLTAMDRTEAQLREKLHQKGYPSEVIDEAVSYVYSFGYLDDLRYAEHFIQSHKGSKSRYEIFGTLFQRGISKELIEQALCECYSPEDELETLQSLIYKQYGCRQDYAQDEKRKICARFVRRGFGMESVQKIMQVSSWNA